MEQGLTGSSDASPISSPATNAKAIGLQGMMSAVLYRRWSMLSEPRVALLQLSLVIVQCKTCDLCLATVCRPYVAKRMPSSTTRSPTLAFIAGLDLSWNFIKDLVKICFRRSGSASSIAYEKGSCAACLGPEIMQCLVVLNEATGYRHMPNRSGEVERHVCYAC